MTDTKTIQDMQLSIDEKAELLQLLRLVKYHRGTCGLEQVRQNMIAFITFGNLGDDTGACEPSDD